MTPFILVGGHQLWGENGKLNLSLRKTFEALHHEGTGGRGCLAPCIFDLGTS
jgi:hypothetical protein